MGNESNLTGSYTYYTSSRGSNFAYSASTARYIDTYAYSSASNNQTAYNRARLGDATGEVTLTTGDTSSWYHDYSIFINSSNAWFLRGGRYVNGANAGPFNFNTVNGGGMPYRSTRAALIGF